VAELVVTSVALDAVFLSAGAAISGWAFALDVSKLLTDPGRAFGQQPMLAAATVIIAVALATLTAWLLATAIAKRTKLTGVRHNRTIWMRVFQRLDTAASSETGITLDMPQAVDRRYSKLVLMELDNGDRVTGICTALSDEPGLEGKRDLALLCPSMEPAPGGEPRAGDVREFNTLVVNEQHIRWFAVLELSGDAVERYVRRHAAARRRIKRDLAAGQPDKPNTEAQSDGSWHDG